MEALSFRREYLSDVDVAMQSHKWCDTNLVRVEVVRWPA